MKKKRWMLRLWVFSTLLASSCVNVRYDELRGTGTSQIANVELESRIQQLEDTLRSLGPNIDPEEASLVADTAIKYALELAESYRLTKPAITHNMLVNAGLRPRGLCVHWAEDILLKLNALELSSFDLYWGVAYPTQPFHLEHSSTVITPTGGKFEDGVVLDGWRYSGILYWSKVKEDTRYNWQTQQNAITQAIDEEK